MDTSYIKLFRKINNNPLISDGTALQVFIWILTNVDRETGTRSFGRFQLAKILKLNPNTLKDAVTRLVDKYKVISRHDTTSDTTSRHHKGYTTIRVLKWAKYQAEKTPTPQPTVSSTPLNKKENIYINNINTKHIDNAEEKNRKLFEKYGLPDPTGYKSMELYMTEKHLNIQQSFVLAELLTGGAK